MVSEPVVLAAKQLDPKFSFFFRNYNYLPILLNQNFNIFCIFKWWTLLPDPIYLWKKKLHNEEYQILYQHHFLGE